MPDTLTDPHETAPGVLVYIGAGAGTRLDDLLGMGFEDIVLIEPNPACHPELVRRTAGHDAVQILQAAVVGAALAQEPQVTLNVLNHAGFSSIHDPQRLSALMPGLRTDRTCQAEALSVAQLWALLPPLAPGRDHWLVLEAPGEEYAILQALAAEDRLTAFRTLGVSCGLDSYFDASLDSAGLLGWLEAQAYRLTQADTSDPDWPLYRLERDDVRLENTALKAQLAALVDLPDRLRAADARKAELATGLIGAQDALHHARAAARADLDAAHKARAAREAELEQTRHALAATQADLDAARKIGASQDSELQKTAQSLSATQGQLDAAHKARAAREAELEQMRRARAATQADLAIARKTATAQQAELEQLRRARAAMQADLDTAQAAKTAQTAQLDETRRALAATQADLDTAQKAKAAREAELDEIRAAHAAETATREAEQQALQDRLGRAEATLDSDRTAHSAERERLQAQADDIRTEVKMALRLQVVAQADKADLQRRFTKLQESYASQEALIRKLTLKLGQAAEYLRQMPALDSAQAQKAVPSPEAPADDPGESASARPPVKSAAKSPAKPRSKAPAKPPAKPKTSSSAGGRKSKTR